MMNADIRMTKEAQMSNDQKVSPSIVSPMNVETRMPHDARAPNDEKAKRPPRYDLEERTAQIGEATFHFAKRIPVNPVTEGLIPQLVNAGTSIGANCCEADDAGTRKEFRYRISVCKRESKETKYRLRMMAAACSEMKEEARRHWEDAKELNLISRRTI